MYGTRDAASRWDDCYSEVLRNLGFTKGVASGCCFHHPGRDVKCVVYGDDFTLLGPEGELKWFGKELAKHFEIKDRGILGPEPGDLREVRTLNRVVRWDNQGVQYEADQRHAELVVRHLELESATSVSSPGLKVNAGDGDDDPP